MTIQNKSHSPMPKKSCKPFYSHICATGKNHIIGVDNKLPWHIPEDLKFFKKKTYGKIVIMGRKNLESLNRPLPGRLNIVISKNPHYKVPKTVQLLSSLEEAYQFCENIDLSDWGREIFIIGGGEIFKQSLSQVTFIYLTRIHRDYKGDTSYPRIPTSQFKEIDRKDCNTNNPTYSFITYKKII